MKQMKVVINKCFGGFGLSPLAVKRMAELKGKPCYFFTQKGYGLDRVLIPVEMPEDNDFFWSAYTVPNPQEVAMSQVDWHSMTLEERAASNKSWQDISLDTRPEDRADLDLVQVVEELGDKASGRCAELKVVSIPDDVEWAVEEYDGLEHIAQKHETWG